MAKNKLRALGTIQIAASLISLHYGLGFLLGTSEMVYKNGISGILYALMCALGLIFLIVLIPFYWQREKPIWTLFQKSYGDKVKNETIFLSWFWMIGVTTSQIIAAAYILNLIGIPLIPSLISVIILTSLISMLPIEKLSKTLLVLLIISSVILIFGVFKLSSLNLIYTNIISIPKSFSSMGLIQFLGITAPTILITMLGMDFHQFIVRGKKIESSIAASCLAAFVLIMLILIPTMIVIGSQTNEILPANIDGKQIIPYVLIFLGKNLFGNHLGYIFLIAMIAVSLGSCSCLMKIMVKTFLGFQFIPKKLKNKNSVNIINCLIIFLLSLKSGTIVSLIVSFYAVYITGVLVPFIAFLIQEKKWLEFHSTTILSTMTAGAVSSVLVLILSKLGALNESISSNLEFAMITVGMVTSTITLISNKIFIEPHFINSTKHYGYRKK